MSSQKFPATERGKKDIGWLQSNFYFSFSDYYNPVKSAFGTLVAFNDDYILPGKGFGVHPHINMEIISVMLAGKMNHKDSLGYSTEIGEGGVQIMSAGSGLRHEEYNVGEDNVNILQIWIQPKQQNIIPRYQQRTFPRERRKNQLKVIVSSEEGPDHCWINQNAKLSLGYFDENHQVNYSCNPVNKCLFVFLIEGNINVGVESLQARDAIGIWDTSEIQIQCNERSQFIIIETPINQK